MSGVDRRRRVETFYFQRNSLEVSFSVFYLVALIQFKYVIKLVFKEE